MIKEMVASAIVFVGVTASAADLSTFAVEQLQASAMSQVGPFGLDWVVGESVDYNLNMGFISGTMVSKVRNEAPEGIWITQDVSIMGQQQQMEILFDKNSGQVLKIIANGKEQPLPDPANLEMIEMKESSVTVPAGTFDCIFARILDKKENKESQAWINPSIVPISGMIKTIAPGPMGEITVEMTGYNDL